MPLGTNSMGKFLKEVQIKYLKN